MKLLFLLLLLGGAGASEIFIVRHCEPDESYRLLSPRGRADSATVAALLAGRGITRILTSPTERTQETAEAIQGLARPPGGLAVEAWLRQEDEHRAGWVPRIRMLAASERGLVLVTHAPVLFALAEALGQGDLEVNYGTVWRLALVEGRLRAEVLKP